MKAITPILISIIATIALITSLHFGYREYSLQSEIEDFSYAALIVNMERQTDDKQFLCSIKMAIEDKKITGSEFVKLTRSVLDSHGVFIGATIGSDHSGAKQQLLGLLYKKPKP